MTFDIHVNNHLPAGRYGLGMARPKTLKRQLDPGFSQRLKTQLQAKGWTNSELARRAKCTRAAIGVYLNGQPKLIEAFLLFAIADALGVEPRWLLFGPSPQAPFRPAVPRRERVSA